MRRLRGGAITAALVALPLALAPGASATEVGSNCTASAGLNDTTGVPLSQAPGALLPLTVPTAGVVTKWKTTLPTVPTGFPVQLKVFRSTANPKQFQVVAESALATALSGANVFDTRIGVEAGDRFGTYGPAPGGALFCTTGNIADTVGYEMGGGTTGSTQTFNSEAKEAQVAVSATVEADADRDGFGDETQDKCPQAASLQVACPALLLDAVAQPAGKASVTILVGTSTDAPVSVTGTVKLPGGSKKARVSAKATLTAVGQTVTPGKIAAFKLKFPKTLKSALAATPKSKKLTLKVKAEGKNVAGVLTTDSLTVKLKGQAKGG